MLHALAVNGFIVLAAVAAAQFDAGVFPLWKAMLRPLGGLLMPYAVALLWGLSVAPPDLREMLRARRSREAKSDQGDD